MPWGRRGLSPRTQGHQPTRDAEAQTSLQRRTSLSRESRPSRVAQVVRSSRYPKVASSIPVRAHTGTDW